MEPSYLGYEAIILWRFYKILRLECHESRIVMYRQS